MEVMSGKTLPLVTHQRVWNGLTVATTVPSDPSPQVMPLSSIHETGIFSVNRRLSSFVVNCQGETEVTGALDGLFGNEITVSESPAEALD